MPPTSASEAKIGSPSLNPLLLCSFDLWFGLYIPGGVLFPLFTKLAPASSDGSASLHYPRETQLLDVNI